MERLFDGKFIEAGTNWVGEPTFKKITKLTLLVNNKPIYRYIERRRIPIADGFFDVETIDGQKAQINTKFIFVAEEYTLVQRIVSNGERNRLCSALVLDNQKVTFELVPALSFG